MDPHNNDTGRAVSFSQVPQTKPDDKTRQSGNNGKVAVDQAIATPSSASIPGSRPTKGQGAEMEDIREFFDDLGGDSYALAVYFGCLVFLIVSILGFWLLPWSWIVALASVLITFVIYRHHSIKRAQPGLQTGRRWVAPYKPGDPIPDTRKLPAVYFLYVLGSGGHTTEMIETIKHKFQGQANQHRRYIVTTGDNDSINRIIRLESKIKDAFPDERRGTIDSFSIPRARKVHQPLLTAPFTCLATAVHAVNALTREPEARPRRLYGTEFKYPHVIVTNGPATGFIVCLVGHVLKMLYLVPQNRLKMVYIESWARTRTLSLTGKLFLWTGIADLFCVQHRELAERTPGSLYVGQVTARLVPPG